ncbi:MAG: diadenylate cyclase CdaA, partial [Myxococcota bacterium]
AADILIVAIGIYWLLLLLRGTRAIQMLVGVFLLIGGLAASKYFQLFTLQFVLTTFLGPGVVLFVVIFQHDIRRALSRVGRGVFFPGMGHREDTQVLEEVVRAAQSCGNKRIGALVVFERETALENFMEAGHSIDALTTRELLVTIFMPGSPLHDGAVLIQRGRVMAAGCLLPLTMNPDVNRDLGTRHRAAIGLTEETDAVVVVVSEQTGTVSVVEAGVIREAADAGELRATLSEALARKPEPKPAREGEAEKPAGGAGTGGLAPARAPGSPERKGAGGP